MTRSKMRLKKIHYSLGALTALGFLSGCGAGVDANLAGTSSPFQTIAAGQYHTCAVFDNGQAKCWGDNTRGQLGQGNDKCALGDGKDDGTGDTCEGKDDLAVGESEMGAFLKVINFKEKVLSVAAGGKNSCFITESRELRCIGDNSDGQGGTLSGAHPPVGHKIGNEAGEMIDSDATDYSAYLKDERVAQVAVGGLHVCALLENRRVKCWGQGLMGQLGNNNNIIDGENHGDMDVLGYVIDLYDAVAISASGEWANDNDVDGPRDVTPESGHTCAILSKGGLKCWGSNTKGQCGIPGYRTIGASALTKDGNLAIIKNNNLVDVGGEVKSVVTGAFHTCALLMDNSVKCWGDNSVGQLGLALSGGQFDNPKSLPAVEFGAEEKVVALAAGLYHTCALIEKEGASFVKCWGQNSTGQLGQNSTTVLGKNAGDIVNMKEIQLGDQVTKITAGGNHTCALLANNTMKCWGANTQGELGLESITPAGNTADSMSRLPAVSLGDGLLLR